MPTADDYIKAVEQALDAIDSQVSVQLSTDLSPGWDAMPDTVELHYIDTPAAHRGQGLGGKALRIVTTLADQYGITLVAQTPTGYDPEDDDDNGEAAMSEDDLLDWYARYGFEDRWSKGALIREPNPVQGG